jgi:dienelactone hydrolase
MSSIHPSRRSLIQGAVAGAVTTVWAKSAFPAEVVPLHGTPARQPVSFRSGGQTCFGVVHTPGTSFGKSSGVLMIHGLVSSKDQPHRIFVTLGDALAAAGFVALRFDLRGRGESDGQTIDITPKADLEDARNALDFLRQYPGVDAVNLIVLGMSWGGDLAAMVSGQSGVKRIALWSSAPQDRPSLAPPTKMKEYPQYPGRRAADVFGNLVEQAFYEGLKELEPLSELKKHRPPVLLVYGTRDEAVPQHAYEKFAGDVRFADESLTAVPIDGADHSFMSHEWEQRAIETTVAWLRGR